MGPSQRHAGGTEDDMLKLYPFIIETLRLLAPFAREIAKHDIDLARQMRRAGKYTPGRAALS